MCVCVRVCVCVCMCVCERLKQGQAFPALTNMLKEEEEDEDCPLRTEKPSVGCHDSSACSHTHTHTHKQTHIHTQRGEEWPLIASLAAFHQAESDC